MPVESPQVDSVKLVMSDDDMAVVARFRVVAELCNLAVRERHARCPDRAPDVDANVNESKTLKKFGQIHPLPNLVILADAKLQFRWLPMSLAQIEHFVFLWNIYDRRKLMRIPINFGNHLNTPKLLHRDLSRALLHFNSHLVGFASLEE